MYLPPAIEISPEAETEEPVLARDPGSLHPRLRHQRPHPGEIRHHLIASGRNALQMASGFVQQVIDIFGRGPNSAGIAPVIVISGPHQGKIAPGNDEEEPVVPAGRQVNGLLAAIDAGNQDVAAAGRPQLRFVFPVESAHPVEPGAGGVDHHPGLHREFLPRFPVAQAGAGHPAGHLQQLHRLQIVDRFGAGLAGRQDILQAEAGVIHPAVPVEGGAAQPFRLQEGFPVGRPAAGEDLVPAGIAEERQQIVQGETGPHLQQGMRVMPVDRYQKRQGMHQMRGDPLQNAPFPARLENQPEVEIFQVAQTAMDQLGGGAGRAGGEIPHLRQDDVQTAQRQIPGQSGAVDAAADDQHVMTPGGQAAEGCGTALDGGRSGIS